MAGPAVVDRPCPRRGVHEQGDHRRRDQRRIAQGDDHLAPRSAGAASPQRSDAAWPDAHSSHTTVSARPKATPAATSSACEPSTTTTRSSAGTAHCAGPPTPAAAGRETRPAAWARRRTGSPRPRRAPGRRRPPLTCALCRRGARSPAARQRVRRIAPVQDPPHDLAQHRQRRLLGVAGHRDRARSALTGGPAPRAGARRSPAARAAWPGWSRSHRARRTWPASAARSRAPGSSSRAWVSTATAVDASIPPSSRNASSRPRRHHSAAPGNSSGRAYRSRGSTT